MSNWGTVITSIISSGVIASVIIFLTKKILEKSIETKFKKAENQHKIDLEEVKRRERQLFDDRYTLYKILNSLIYKVRNSYKDLAWQLENETHLNVSKSLRTKFNKYYTTLENLLFENKFILPDILFKELHDLKHCLSRANKNLHFLSEIYDGNQHSIIIQDIKIEYSKIENHYNTMQRILQSESGNKK